MASVKEGRRAAPSEPLTSGRSNGECNTNHSQTQEPTRVVSDDDTPARFTPGSFKTVLQNQIGKDVPPDALFSLPVSVESGKSRMLVSEELAMSPSTGLCEARRVNRTVIPIPVDTLSGVDENGTPIPADYSFMEQSLALYSVLIEYYQMHTFNPPGLYCIPSFDNIREWHGAIFIRRGLYMGGSFRFYLSIPEKYPGCSPSVHFIDQVYHPLVHPETGEVDCSHRFPSWTSHDYLPMMLAVVKQIFYCPKLLSGASCRDTPNNPKAYESMAKDKKLHLEAVSNCVQESRINIVNLPPRNFDMQFTEYHRQHKSVFRAIRTLAHDKTCPNATESFLHWFLEEICSSELDGLKATAENHEASS